MKKLVLVAILAMVVMAVSFGGVFAQTEFQGDNNVVVDGAAELAINGTFNVINNAPVQTATAGNNSNVNQKLTSNVKASAKGAAVVDGGAVDAAPAEVNFQGDGNVVVNADVQGALNLTGNLVNNTPNQTATAGNNSNVNQELESNVDVSACGVAVVGDACIDLEDFCCECEVECCEEEECECCCVVKTTVPKTSDVASLASVVALVVSGLGAAVVGKKVR